VLQDRISERRMSQSPLPCSRPLRSHASH
jgi:hypothetical protein